MKRWCQAGPFPSISSAIMECKFLKKAHNTYKSVYCEADEVKRNCKSSARTSILCDDWTTTRYEYLKIANQYRDF